MPAAPHLQQIGVAPGDAPRLQQIVAAPGVAAHLPRDARRPRLLGLPADVGERLLQLFVIIVGLGSIGMHLSDLLARLGIARLLLVDPAPVKPETLVTHPCFPWDLLRPKVFVAGERAASLCPEGRVQGFPGPFESLPDHAIAGASCILLAGDNLGVEVAVAQRALHFGVPVLQGSVYGPTLSAQVRALTGTSEGDGPCAACLFQRQEWQALDRGTVFSCVGGSSAPDAPAERSAVPTTSPPQLCGLAANLVVTELVARTLGLPGADQSRLVDYCGFNHQTRVTPLTRNVACALDHERLCVEVREDDPGTWTPRALLGDAGYGQADLRRVTLRVEGRRFSRLATCGCDPHPRVGAFVVDSGSAGICPDCREERMSHPFESWRDVPAALLEAGLDQDLEKLGGGGATSVRVRGEQGGTLFVGRNPQ